MPAKIQPCHVGDGIEVTAPGGEAARRGMIVDVLGGDHHERYLVRRLDGHESIHYPSDGTRIRPPRAVPVTSHRRLPVSAEGTHRWHVELADREPLEVELQGAEREPLELSDEQLNLLLPTALERAANGRDTGSFEDHDIPWDEPVRLFGDHFRG